MTDQVLLVLILEKEEYLNSLLMELSDAGVHSATLLNSSGMMGHLASLKEETIISTLRPLFVPAQTENKTILMVLDEDQVESVRQVIRGVLGDLSDPETAILFGLPLLFTEGIRDYE